MTPVGKLNAISTSASPPDYLRPMHENSGATKTQKRKTASCQPLVFLKTIPYLYSISHKQTGCFYNVSS